jgi:hypothetical protein
MNKVGSGASSSGFEKGGESKKQYVKPMIIGEEKMEILASGCDRLPGEAPCDLSGKFGTS